MAAWKRNIHSLTRNNHILVLKVGIIEKILCICSLSVKMWMMIKRILLNSGLWGRFVRLGRARTLHCLRTWFMLVRQICQESLGCALVKDLWQDKKIGLGNADLAILFSLAIMHSAKWLTASFWVSMQTWWMFVPQSLQSYYHFKDTYLHNGMPSLRSKMSQMRS